MRKMTSAAAMAAAMIMLNGCNEAAPPANAAPDTSAVAKTDSASASNVTAPALQTAEDWPGEYRATIEGGKADLSIGPAKAGLYDIEIGVGGAGNSGSCSGSAEGKGTAKGNVISVAVVAEFMDSGTCTMTLTRSGNRIAVSNGTCPPLTGAACTLEGSYTRSAAKPATVAAQPALATWIVGAWVEEDGYCASGVPLVFASQGGYRNSGGDIKGRWSLAGSSLTLAFREVDSTTGNATGPTRRTTLALTKVGPNDMRLGSAALKRCPTKDGVEPWHRDVTFDTE